jgi:hypothetical protein
MIYTERGQHNYNIFFTADYLRSGLTSVRITEIPLHLNFIFNNNDKNGYFNKQSDWLQAGDYNPLREGLLPFV